MAAKEIVGIHEDGSALGSGGFSSDLGLNAGEFEPDALESPDLLEQPPADEPDDGAVRAFERSLQEAFDAVLTCQLCKRTNADRGT